jgi:hypothetical protein
MIGVKVQQYEGEVHLVFITESQEESNKLFNDISEQMRDGIVQLTLVGPPGEADFTYVN